MHTLSIIKRWLESISLPLFSYIWAYNINKPFRYRCTLSMEWLQADTTRHRPHPFSIWSISDCASESPMRLYWCRHSIAILPRLPSWLPTNLSLRQLAHDGIQPLMHSYSDWTSQPCHHLRLSTRCLSGSLIRIWLSFAMNWANSVNCRFCHDRAWISWLPRC